MAVLPDRRTSSMAEWARSIASFSAVLFLTAGVGHRYRVVETVAYFWVLGIVAALALIALGLAAGGFSRLWNHGERAGRASLAATLIASAVLAPYLVGAWLVVRHPALTDIATDLVEPPEFAYAGRQRSGAMNPIVPITPDEAKQQIAAYPDLSGRRLDGSVERALNAVSAVATAHGWSVFITTHASAPRNEQTIEYDAPTYLVRFPADAAVRLTDEGETTFVDMRIVSRYGRHDLGDGARRIRGFMADLEAEFTRQSLEIIDIPASPEGEDPVD